MAMEQNIDITPAPMAEVFQDTTNKGIHFTLYINGHCHGAFLDDIEVKTYIQDWGATWDGNVVECDFTEEVTA